MEAILGRTPTKSQILAGLIWLFALALAPGRIHAEIPEYSEALKKYQAGQYEESLNLIRSVFDANRKSQRLRMLAAANYLAQGNIQSAKDHLLFCIQDHPKSAAPRALLASLYRQQGNPQKSLKIAAQAIRQTGDSPGLRLELASSYLALRNYKAAHAHLARAVALDPESFHAIYIDGLVYLAEGNLDNAEFRFRNALELPVPGKSTLAALYSNLGYVIEKKADRTKAEGKTNRAMLSYSEARRLYKQALEILPAYKKAASHLKRVEDKLEL